METIKLTAEQCGNLLATGDIPKEVVQSAPCVAVIFTQSWCHQWVWMRDYLKVIDSKECKVYWIEYDLEAFYERLMTFKEETWNSMEIPYVRYYKKGQFTGESYFVDVGAFRRLLGVV